MLQIKNIRKQYQTGDLVQVALNDVSLNLRDNEFVSILGTSGSGKSTLLNVIGGLDRYDSGDLIINGISTKQYKDKDWDIYRNHTVGFIFQSYNLIPHQTVLANVELALTISGVPRKERKARAAEALNKVGLAKQLYKKPNQMSGGQMQRVAIARALVNDPDILLADEPTGALDTETSIQIMELLKEVAKDKLVVMVTHNPELAQLYSTRIVRLQDGNILDDSMPYEPSEEEILNSEQKAKEKEEIKEESAETLESENGEDSAKGEDTANGEEKKPKQRPKQKAKMSFWTALSLSFNNLRTKKGRTLLTSFAGSIGIIGIALILALSSSVNAYIANVQQETMNSYPLTIGSQSLTIQGPGGEPIKRPNKTDKVPNKGNGIFANFDRLSIAEIASSSMIENNLQEFKKYLDNPDSEIHKYVGENGIRYKYDVLYDIYCYDELNRIVNTGSDASSLTSAGGHGGVGSKPRLPLLSTKVKNFKEIMGGADGQLINDMFYENYEVLKGSWASEYNEVVLVLDQSNSLSPAVLYQLGLITAEDYVEIVDKVSSKEEMPEMRWDYDDLIGYTFYLVPAYDRYTKNENGTFSYIKENSLTMNEVVKNGIELKITGIIRPKDNAEGVLFSSPVVYTSKLTDYLINGALESDIVKAQLATPDINVLTGTKFEIKNDDDKIEAAKVYISNLSIPEKSAMYKLIMFYQTKDQKDVKIANTFALDDAHFAGLMDQWLEKTPDDDMLLRVFNEYIGQSSYKTNMKNFGKVDYDRPSSIDIYTDSFEDNDGVKECIERYNEGMEQDNKILYTDYVAALTSAVSSIINTISYVLIGFVAVSLVVSAIMIGIITHISVMERTKEIGILRALGTSKRNVSQVFNAETFIIGCCSGLLGIIVTGLLTIPANIILKNLLGDLALKVSLPFVYAGILVVLGILITVLGGLIPARNAAKKDPVIALRGE